MREQAFGDASMALGVPVRVARAEHEVAAEWHPGFEQGDAVGGAPAAETVGLVVRRDRHQRQAMLAGAGERRYADVQTSLRRELARLKES